MKRTRTEIIIEQQELFIVMNGKSAIERRWCSLCSAEVEMVAPDLAAAIAGMGQRVIYRLIESSRLHFDETSRGLVLVCSNSLRQVSK